MASDLPRSWSPSQTTARQREIIRLMALGVTMPEIARRLGNITESAARKLGRRALIAQAADLRAAGSFDEALALYLIRVEMMLSTWLPKAFAGDEKAAEISHRYLSMVADVQGFKAMPRDSGAGDADQPAPADLVAGALDRLEQLAQRLNPGVIDGQVVDDEEEETPDDTAEPLTAATPAEPLGGSNAIS